MPWANSLAKGVRGITYRSGHTLNMAILKSSPTSRQRWPEPVGGGQGGWGTRNRAILNEERRPAKRGGALAGMSVRSVLHTSASLEANLSK